MIIVMNNGDFGRNVRRHRTLHRMSRKRLGKILKLHPVTIKRIETGELVDIPYPWLRGLCRVFRVDSATLIDGQ